MFARRELSRAIGDRLEAIHHLLPDLARAVDERDVLAQLTAAASQVIPHDEAHLTLATAGGSRVWRITHPSDEGPIPPIRIEVEDDAANEDATTPRLLEDLPAHPRGMRSGVRTPVRIGDEFIGVVGFLSRAAGLYTDADLAFVQRMADFVAIALSHHRLMEQARRAAADRERAAALAGSEELLRTLSNTLDIREVFVRVSDIVARVLPHDRLTMSLYDDATGESCGMRCRTIEDRR